MTILCLSFRLVVNIYEGVNSTDLNLHCFNNNRNYLFLWKLFLITFLFPAQNPFVSGGAVTHGG